MTVTSQDISNLLSTGFKTILDFPFYFYYYLTVTFLYLSHSHICIYFSFGSEGYQHTKHGVQNIQPAHY